VTTGAWNAIAIAGAVVAGLALRRPAGRALTAIRRLAGLPRMVAGRARAAPVLFAQRL
jgi:hypothetical protein